MSQTHSISQSLESLRQTVTPVCEHHAVARLEVFGSVARGESGPGSDVDLLVEFLPGANVGLFEMGELQSELEQRLGCPVDLISRRAVENSRNPIRKRHILDHPITIYAR